jgi:hypothetical protein
MVRLDFSHGKIGFLKSGQSIRLDFLQWQNRILLEWTEYMVRFFTMAKLDFSRVDRVHRGNCEINNGDWE